MSRFIESICWENGRYQLLDLHQERMVKTCQTFFRDNAPDLKEHLPTLEGNQKQKVRVLYTRKIEVITSSYYQRQSLTKLRFVQCDEIDYAFKYEYRQQLTSLKRDEREEIAIVKQGFVTDASYANLAFFDGTSWYTPSTYLLNGVKRQHLLSKGMVKEIPITLDQLHHFQTVSLINAMLDIGDVPFEAFEISP